MAVLFNSVSKPSGYIPVSCVEEVQRQTGASSVCFKMHLNRGAKTKKTSTLDHRNRTKEVKVQKLWDEMFV